MLMMRSQRKKYATTISNISTVADLVACRPYFQVGCVVHRYIGRQTQVMEDDQEIGAYMFRRTVPSMHLTPDDVRWMIGAWRDRIILCTGIYGPKPALIKALLDSGAKAVICPSTEPQETQLTIFQGEFGTLENGKFEIGDEEIEEEEEAEPASPASDWEDSEPEKGGGDRSVISLWDDDEELSQFVCQLYDSLFRGGAKVEIALQQALASHRSMRYSCHLPTVP